LRARAATTTVYNLTVSDTHTYYVLAGEQSVLVHNCGGRVAEHDSQCRCAEQPGNEGTDLQAIAKRFREENGLADNRNVAVFEYTTASGRSRTVTMANIPRGTPGTPAGLHSEVLIGRELARRGVDPLSVTRIYSERIPCPVCTRAISKYKNATVFWDP
jgi:hypothetical protein